MEANQIKSKTLGITEVVGQRPLIIAGPCSAETEEQVLATAEQLAETGMVHILRAGIWKPRTRPGSFEGVGKAGLPWLVEARRRTGLPFAVEVASARQVEEALRHDTDVLWIGARTTVNPFSVQELADALKGVKVPVLIKNPVNPDVELWTGALERILKAGVAEAGLVHRGFSAYGNTGYRNAPMWHLAIEMKRRYPEILMLCDPSHICGRRSIIAEVSQKAVDLDYDGLMVESHIHPDQAWSDPLQQLTPADLKQMLSAIQWRSETIAEHEFVSALEKLRDQINHLDDELLQLLGQRMRIADMIGAYKKDNNVTILQPTRWSEILDKAFKRGEMLGLSQDFIKKYFDAVHMESIQHQNRVMNEKDNTNSEDHSL